MKVTILDRNSGVWSQTERSALMNTCMVEIQSNDKMPARLVIATPSLDGTFAEALGHSDFTEKEVDYADRWQ